MLRQRPRDVLANDRGVVVRARRERRAHLRAVRRVAEGDREVAEPRLVADAPDGAPTRALEELGLCPREQRDEGAAVQTDEQKVAPATFTEVGHGVLDFPAILKAAHDAGVAHYYVEQDHTPGDPLASLRQSYRYLRTLA